jgi:hypothetical protein
MNQRGTDNTMRKKDKQWHTQAMNQRRTDNTMGKKTNNDIHKPWIREEQTIQWGKRQTMTYTSHESEKNRQYNGEKRQAKRQYAQCIDYAFV